MTSCRVVVAFEHQVVLTDEVFPPSERGVRCPNVQNPPRALYRPRATKREHRPGTESSDFGRRLGMVDQDRYGEHGRRSNCARLSQPGGGIDEQDHGGWLEEELRCRDRRLGGRGRADEVRQFVGSAKLSGSRGGHECRKLGRARIASDHDRNGSERTDRDRAIELPDTLMP